MDGIIESLPLWLWLLLALAALFVARGPAHRGIHALVRLFHQSLRLAAGVAAGGASRLQVANADVLLAAGREAAERRIEREFERIEGAMKKELAQYPALHRRLCERLTAIDEDYVRSAEVPPEPTNWAKAIKAVADIPAKQDQVVADVLDTIHYSMRRAEGKALEAYRESVRERHQLLKRMMPHWRAILTALGGLNRNVTSLLSRARALDSQIQHYEDIREGSGPVLRQLASASFTQFLVSGLALAVAVGAALVNFYLIAGPVGALVDGGAIGGFALADISALVLVLLQVSCGLMALECLGVTRLFPALGALEDALRRRIWRAALGLLLCLALIQAALAWSGAPLRGLAVAEAHWLARVIPAGLGLVLPLALAFAGVPLERFATAARAVLLQLLGGALGLLSLALRLLGTACLGAGTLLVRLYDILIFLPLWLEQRFIAWRQGGAEKAI